MHRASTFAEGWRSIFGWAIIAAGMFCGAMATGLIAIFVWGGWPTDRYEQIITILGIGMGGFLAGMMIVMVAMAVGGPVGRFKGGVGKDGLNFEASGDDAPVADQKVADAAQEQADEFKGGGNA